MPSPDLLYAATEAARCLLCYDPPCSKACGKADTGKAVRSLFFRNIRGAAQTATTADCASCTTQACLKACTRRRMDRAVDLPRVMPQIVVQNNALPHVEGSAETRPSLEIDFCGFHCENPFVLASSVITSSYELCASALRAGWGGVAVKTLTYAQIDETSPRFDISDKAGIHFSGFKNLEQLSEHPVDKDLQWIRRLKEDFPTKLIIVSIMGRDEREWEELARKSEEHGADIIECNFSCPQMTYCNMGSDTGQNSRLVERYTRACRRGTSKPILAKLTPNLSSPHDFVQAAIDGGADGIAGINTIKSLTTVDFWTSGNSGVEGKTAVSGYSGRAVKPVALRFMHDTAQILPPAHHTLSGIGGVVNWRDALDFLLVGCANVQVCTAVMEYGQRIIEDLTEGLTLFLKACAMPRLDPFVGTAAKNIVSPADLNRTTILYPEFHPQACIRCGRCYISCRDGGHQAIRLVNGRTPELLRERCVGCHLCRFVCPVGAIGEGERRPK